MSDLWARLSVDNVKALPVLLIAESANYKIMVTATAAAVGSKK